MLCERQNRDIISAVSSSPIIIPFPLFFILKKKTIHRKMNFRKQNMVLYKGRKMTQSCSSLASYSFHGKHQIFEHQYVSKPVLSACLIQAWLWYYEHGSEYLNTGPLTCPWWVNFASGQVGLQFTCPDGQVEIFEKYETHYNIFPTCHKI